MRGQRQSIRQKDLIGAVRWQYVVHPFSQCFGLRHIVKDVCSICHRVPQIQNKADLHSPETLFAHTYEAIFFTFPMGLIGQIIDYCGVSYLPCTHTHTHRRWCFSTSVFPRMWKDFLYSQMSHFMFGWQSLILFYDDAYCSVNDEKALSSSAPSSFVLFCFFLSPEFDFCFQLFCSLLLPIRPASLCNVSVCVFKKENSPARVWGGGGGGLPCLWKPFSEFRSTAWANQAVTLGAPAVAIKGRRACRLFQVKTASARVTTGAPQPFEERIWANLAQLKGKKGQNRWLDHNHTFVHVSESIVVCLCEEPPVFGIPLDMYLPERLLSFGGGGGGGGRPCYNVGENCQHVLLIGACFIQCWCVVVLVHTCLFNHPPLFFLSSRGWGLKAGGGSYSRKDRR